MPIPRHVSVLEFRPRLKAARLVGDIRAKWVLVHYNWQKFIPVQFWCLRTLPLKIHAEVYATNQYGTLQNAHAARLRK